MAARRATAARINAALMLDRRPIEAMVRNILRTELRSARVARLATRRNVRRSPRL
jgi:hypothetical protein